MTALSLFAKPGSMLRLGERPQPEIGPRSRPEMAASMEPAHAAERRSATHAPLPPPLCSCRRPSRRRDAHAARMRRTPPARELAALAGHVSAAPPPRPPPRRRRGDVRAGHVGVVPAPPLDQPLWRAGHTPRPLLPAARAGSLCSRLSPSSGIFTLYIAYDTQNMINECAGEGGGGTRHPITSPQGLSYAAQVRDGGGRPPEARRRPLHQFQGAETAERLPREAAERQQLRRGRERQLRDGRDEGEMRTRNPRALPVATRQAIFQRVLLLLMGRSDD